MKLRGKWTVTSIVIIAAIAISLVYHFWKPENGQEKEGAPVISSRRDVLNVNATIIDRESSVIDPIFISGRLIPDEEVSLSFETSGKIVAINFTEGTQVKKGQLLAKVNDATLQAQLTRYEVQLQLAQDRVYRQNVLLERDAVSQEAYEQASTDLAMLEADINLVKANIALTELRAPFDGIIGLRYVSEGAYASPSVAVATLTKISPLKIDFSIPERYSADVRQGTRLSFTVDGFLNNFTATVYAVDPVIHIDNLMQSIRATYPNTDQKIMPGRFANIQLTRREIPNAIMIPSQAVIPEMGVDKVFLYRNGVAEPVEIEAGIRTDATVEVVRGLKTGDTLITSGTLQLRTGLPVTITEIN